MLIARTLEEAESLPDMTVDLNRPDSVVGVWEALKAVVGEQFIANAAHANALQKEKRHQLEVRVKELEERHRGADAGEAKRQLGVACKELWALDMDVAEHAMLRTKQKYSVGGGDKAGQLLAHRLRAQAIQHQINKIQTQNGAAVTKDGLILQEFEKC
ncbi:hypothetical protein NDU88_011042 [Pleurodeles waltl]|uniref:Uncharacterized protein n=1 Tax=Pleurodeles waltl TaxID=8319 RepID=A0AAV7Q0M8_PLEWA|nr:hypothetical protein NDU88_011042 [Pleurodeles waltl]